MCIFITITFKKISLKQCNFFLMNEFASGPSITAFFLFFSRIMKLLISLEVFACFSLVTMTQFSGLEVERGRKLLCAKGQAQALSYWGGGLKRVNNSLTVSSIINADILTLDSETTRSQAILSVTKDLQWEVPSVINF